VHAEPAAVTIFRVAICVPGQRLFSVIDLRTFRLKFKLNDVTIGNFIDNRNMHNFPGRYIGNKHGSCSKLYRSENKI